MTAAAQTASIPIRIIRLEKNSGGPARPLNVGVAAATAPLVAVLDQDDVFALDKLETQARVLAADPEVAVVFSWCAALGGSGEPVQSADVVADVTKSATAHGDHLRLSPRQTLWLLLRHGNFTMGWPGFLFRREAWGRLGGADESFRISSDYDFLCRLALAGPAALVPRVLYFRRDHPANLCKREREVCIETGRVKARYLEREPWLLDDPELARALREELIGVAWWVRESGDTWESLRHYLRTGRLLGWDVRLLWATAKLLPHGLLRLFGRSTAGPGR